MAFSINAIANAQNWEELRDALAQELGNCISTKTDYGRWELPGVEIQPAIPSYVPGGNTLTNHRVNISADVNFSGNVTGLTTVGAVRPVYWGVAESNWRKGGGDPWVPVKTCDDYTGANPVGGGLVVYLPRAGGQDPNIIKDDVIAYVETESGDKVCVSDYLDDKIGTVKLWTGAVADIAPGWKRMDGVDNADDAAEPGSGIAMYDNRTASETYGESYTAFGASASTACTDTVFGSASHNHTIGSGSLVGDNKTSEAGGHSHTGSKADLGTGLTGGAQADIDFVADTGHDHMGVGDPAEDSSVDNTGGTIDWATTGVAVADHPDHSHFVPVSGSDWHYSSDDPNASNYVGGAVGYSTHTGTTLGHTVTEPENVGGNADHDGHTHGVSGLTFELTMITDGAHDHGWSQTDHTHDLTGTSIDVTITEEPDHQHYVYLDPEYHLPLHKLLHYIERIDNSAA